MAEHPLVQLSNAMRNEGGDGMEMRERPYGKGAALRLWCPSFAGAGRLAALAARLGLTTSLPMGHVERIEDVEYRGAQIVVTIPPEMVRSAQAAMAEAQREIGRATPELEA